MENQPNPSDTEIFDEISESLREIKLWARLIGFPAAKATLETVLNTDEKKVVYHLCDGNRNAKEIAALSGVNVRFVSEWGQAWEAIGILMQSKSKSVKGRRQKVFELSNFGMSIPSKMTKIEEVSTNEFVA